MPCKRLRDADRRENAIAINVNPSVSLAADSSPYTGEPLGRCAAEGEMKLGHSLCRQSLLLISFATSLYTREAMGH